MQKAVLERIKGGKMAASWSVLTEFCDEEKIAVGLQRLSDEELEKLKEDMAAKAEAEGVEFTELTPEQEEALRWTVWTAVPSKDEKIAVVELAAPNEAAATYVYRIETGWPAFLTDLNRAMEATGFNREVITLTEMQLQEGEHKKDRMLIQRTPALNDIRKAYAGKVIHRSQESWKEGIRKYLKEE